MIIAATRSKPDRAVAITTVALVALTALTWLPGLSGAFHYDDLPNIVLDPATAGGAALLDRLANGFRPLLRLSYVFDHALWGFSAAGFIATNLALHIATVLLVWRLACHRLSTPLAATAAAVIFALQPAHGAVVAWASGRSSGISTALLLAALLAHEHAIGAPARRRHALALGLMIAACLAKEVALVFPLIVVLWEVTRQETGAWRRVLRRAAPSFVAATLLLGVMILASTRLQSVLVFSLSLATPLEALVANLAALPATLGLWFQPWALAVEHPAPNGDVAAISGFVAVATLIGIAILAARISPVTSLALLWPLVLLLPSHSVIARLDLIVEKPLYAAWVGPSLALGAAAGALLQAPRRRAPTVLAAVACAAILAAASSWRATMWADPVALWREATHRAPDSARSWINRAIAELEAGEVAAARRWLTIARAIDPQAAKIGDAEFALGLMIPGVGEETVR